MFFNSLFHNFYFEVRVPGCYLVSLCQISSLSMADHVLYSFCCYFWFWGGSTWVLSGKSFSNLKFKYGWSFFLSVFVVIFDLEVGVFGFYQVILHQFSSLSMADHVFLTVYVIIFDFEVGVPGFYLVNLHQFSSLSMADHVFHQFMSFYWFWGGSTWVLLGKSFSIFKFKHGWSCFLTVFVVIFDFEVGVPGLY